MFSNNSHIRRLRYKNEIAAAAGKVEQDAVRAVQYKIEVNYMLLMLNVVRKQPFTNRL